MLRHDQNEESILPAAQQRVTAEELNQALKTLDADRQAQAEYVQGTVPIGQVVDELRLEATPEEIWAQVKAQRARRARTRPTLGRAQIRRPVWDRRMWAALAGVLLAARVLAPHHYHHPGEITVNGNGVVQTYTGDGLTLTIQGNDDNITLRGRDCTVVIHGNDNQVAVSGTVADAAANGNDNTLTWTEERPGAAPSITNDGNGNRIGPADR